MHRRLHGASFGLSAFFAFVVAAGAQAQGGAVSFTALPQYVTFPNTADLAPQGGFTVEAWGKLSPQTFGFPVVVNAPALIQVPAYETPNFSGYFMRSFYAGGLNLVVSPGCGAGGPTAPATGAWHHYACTYGATTSAAYFDGVLVGTASACGPPPIVGGTGKIGFGHFLGGEQWTGQLDEVRIWNYERTQQEISEDLHRVLDQRPGLVAAWHFDGDFTDAAGGHDGAPFNGAQIVPSTAPVFRALLSTGASLAPGAPWVFEASTERKNALYVVDVSFSGAVPGAPLGGGFLAPLNRPWLYLDVGAFVAPQLFENFVGLVGPDEKGVAVFYAPADPFLEGLPMFSSFAALDYDTLAVFESAPAAASTITSSAPTITSMSPASVPVGGGTTTVTGTNFQPTASTKIAGKAAATTYVSPTTLLCSVPPGVAGAVVVEVCNGDGGTAYLPHGFHYAGPLILDAVSPKTGPPDTTLLVTGSGFLDGSTVTLGTNPVAIMSLSRTELTVLVPPGVGCDAALVINGPDGQSQFLTWNPSPTIVGTINGVGPASGGGTVLLLGDFMPPMTATIGGVPAVVTMQTGSAMVVVVPPSVAGTASLAVTSPNGCFAATNYIYL